MKSIHTIVLLICATAFAANPLLYDSYHAPKMLLCVVIPLVSITIACLYNLIKKGTFTFCISVIEFLLLAQLLWGVLSNPGVLTNTSSLDFYFLVSLFLITAIVRQIQVREQAMSTNQDQPEKKSPLLLIIRTIWIVGVCQALIGFAQYYTIFDRLPIGMGKTRMIGSIGAANGYGAFIAITTMGLVIELIEARSIKLKMVLLVCGVVLLSGLLFNGSRGALLGLVGAIIVFILIERKNKQNFTENRKREENFAPLEKKKLAQPQIRFVILMSSFALLFCGVSVYLYHLNVESSKGRIFVWSVSAPMVMDHPIAGVGVGRYSVEYLYYQSRFFQDGKNQSLAYKASNIKQALSEYVQVLCESGIIGALLFASIWGSALWFYFSNQRQSFLFAGTVSMIIILLIHMTVDTPLHIIPVSVVAASLLGYAPVPAKWVWQFQIGSRNLGILFFCILAAVVVLVGIKSEEYYQGHIYWQRGYELNMQHRWLFAIQEYEKALAELPQEGELLFHLGAAQVLANSYSNGIYHLLQSRLWYNDRNIYLSLSQGYLGLHQYAEAERCAKIAVSMFPDHLAPHLLLGQIYFETGRIKESKESLLKCIGRETTIRSDEVEQIRLDGQNLWKQYYQDDPEISAAP